jgi:hypothetical protein
MNVTDRIINAIQPTPSFQQSENSALKYTFNYSSLLQTDTISTSTFTSAPNLTIASTANTNTTATAIISGQTGWYDLINKIVTAGGQTEERKLRLHITRNDTTPVAGDYE